VLDPFLAVPIYISVTAGQRPRERLRLVNVVTLTVFAVLASAALFGERLLRLMGASLPAFQVGGGLVLLLMALSMLNAQVGQMRQTRAEAEELESRQSGVVPLAVPLLAGPGAIGTTIIAAQSGGVAHGAMLVLCVALVCVLLFAVLRLAQPIGARMGTTGLNIATRLLGLLLAAIAIQTMAEGLKVLFPGLA
jgi:multiple antibiotic resistance protein